MKHIYLLVLLLAACGPKDKDCGDEMLVAFRVWADRDSFQVNGPGHICITTTGSVACDWLQGTGDGVDCLVLPYGAEHSFMPGSTIRARYECYINGELAQADSAHTFPNESTAHCLPTEITPEPYCD